MGHLKGKYTRDYFLGGFDPITGARYGVAGFQEFKEKVVSEGARAGVYLSSILRRQYPRERRSSRSALEGGITYRFSSGRGFGDIAESISPLSPLPSHGDMSLTPE